MIATDDGLPVPVTIAVCAARERVRGLARRAFPRRRCRLILTRSADDLHEALRATLVDAVVVDAGSPSPDMWRGVEMARDYPSVPFFAVMPMRPNDGAALARCAAAECTDVCVEGVDDFALRGLVLPQSYTARFAAALHEPPPGLKLDAQLQQAAWRVVVGWAGRAIRTDTVAAALGVTREHLSRAFSQGGNANLKRLIDFVRLVSAAELSKNPGFDVGDVARILDFASSSHLSTTAQRIIGTRPVSLARLRTVDLVERFVHGRTRSRGISEIRS